MSSVRFAPPDERHRGLERRAIEDGIPSEELIEKALYSRIEQGHPVQLRLPLARSVEIERYTKGT